MTEHETKFEAIAQEIGIDKLRAVLETGTYGGIFRKSKPVKAFPAPAKMAELAQADPHLNNWPLAHWDAQDSTVRGLLEGTGIKSWSLANTVCTLKHVAKFHYTETLEESETRKPKPPAPEPLPEPEPLPTIEQFITKHGVKFDCRRVAKRPDGLMDADYSKDGLPVTRAKDQMRHFHCRIGVVSRSFSLYFSQGSAHTQEPTLADVLDCLASDASGYDGCAFGDWASEYGYDTDSRKAEKIFRAIKRQAEQLKRTLGEEAYKELLWNTERL